MNKIGKYIYGIIPRLRSGQVNSNTTFHLYTTKNSSEVEMVYTIPYQDISAVVSDSKIVDYTHMLKDAMARLLVKHQQVIERIMNLEHTIIPLRLGTFAIDDVEVKDILNKGYSLTKDIMEKVSDKIEIDIVATWSDFNSVLKELSEEKEIRELKQTFLTKKAGVTVDDQMKVGVLVKRYLDKRREEFTNKIQASLNRFTQDFKTHGLMDDKMVVNTAFLIDKDRKKDFEEEIEGLNTEFEEKLNFRCVGPLPPYSFYTLEIKKMKFEEVDWARKRFGLNDIVTKEEIKNAHKRQAFISHPDKNPNIPEIEKEFSDVTRAYNILTDYCCAFEQTGHEENYSFKETEFKKNKILVTVRR